MTLSFDQYSERHEEVKKSLKRLLRSCAVFLFSASLSIGALGSISLAHAADTDLLNVAFGGSLESGGLTTQADEILKGAVTRKDGGETQETGKIVLAGGNQGLFYTSARTSGNGTVFFTLGEGVATNGFTAEVKYIPQANQNNLATIFSAGGNLFVRYVDAGHLEYGLSYQQGGRWADTKQTILAPPAGKEHALSVTVWPKNGGTAVRVAVDGNEYPEIVSPAPAAVSNGLESKFGFGAEVHTAPNAQNRGLKGSLQALRFTPANSYNYQDGFEFQPAESQEGNPDDVPCAAWEEIEPATQIAVSPADCREHILKKASLVRPTREQLRWQEQELTAFIHYGVNTFYNQGWGHGTEDPQRFAPTDLDVDQWVKNLAEAGFGTVILTVKHHDGFLLYDSRYTDHDIGSSAVPNADIPRDVAKAAKKYGMRVGFYLSPADSSAEIKGLFGNGSAKTERTIPTLIDGDDRSGKIDKFYKYPATDYGEYFLNQLYEVLTQYGDVDEVWFDGAAGNTDKHELFDYSAYYDLIRQLQPNAVIAVGGPDVRWIGNEEGRGRANEPSVIPVKQLESGKIDISGQAGHFNQNLGSDDQIVNAVRSGGAQYLRWWPAEADMKLTRDWFWQIDADEDNSTVKSGTALWNKYLENVARNSVMLLNVPPNKTGKFSANEIKALQDFAVQRRKAFALDHALGRPVNVGGENTRVYTDNNLRTGGQAFTGETSFEVDLGAEKTVNYVSLAEDTLNNGQNIQSFVIEKETTDGWQPVKINRNSATGTVGVRRIVQLAAPETAQKFRVRVTDNRGPFALSDLRLFGSANQDPEVQLDYYVDSAAKEAGLGTLASPFNSLEQLRGLRLPKGAKIHLKSGAVFPQSDLRYYGFGTDEQPIIVDVYGGDQLPKVGEGTAWDEFAPKMAAGWQLNLPKPQKPDAKIAASEWQDVPGSSDCGQGKVSQSRAVTTTDYRWDTTRWILDDANAVEKTETRLREMTAAEKSACPGNKPGESGGESEKPGTNTPGEKPGTASKPGTTAPSGGMNTSNSKRISNAQQNDADRQVRNPDLVNTGTSAGELLLLTLLGMPLGLTLVLVNNYRSKQR